jgi:hypothetical protein
VGGGRIVVRLPFCTAPACLPVLFRLWAGKGTASPVELAAQLLGLIAAEFGGRRRTGWRCRLPRQATAGSDDHGKPLLVPTTTWTTRLPVNAALYDPAPPRTDRRRRPTRKGAKLGTPAPSPRAPTGRGHRRPVRPHRARPSHPGALYLARQLRQRGRCVLVREEDSTKPYDPALFTLHDTLPPPPTWCSATRYGGRSSRRTPPASSRLMSGRHATE